MRDEQISQQKVGWRVRERRLALGLGHTKTAELVKNGDVDSVLVGSARIITTSPRQYLARVAERQAERAA